MHTLAGLLIKKASGRCANTNPTDTARYTRSHMLRGLYHFIFAPALLATGRGPLFYLHPGRSPESQAKERQQRQDNEASHGGQLLYPCGSMRRVSAWSDRVTDICVQRAGCDGNKKALGDGSNNQESETLLRTFKALMPCFQPLMFYTRRMSARVSVTRWAWCLPKNS